MCDRSLKSEEEDQGRASETTREIHQNLHKQEVPHRSFNKKKKLQCYHFKIITKRVGLDPEFMSVRIKSFNKDGIFSVRNYKYTNTEMTFILTMRRN